MHLFRTYFALISFSVFQCVIVQARCKLFGADPDNMDKYFDKAELSKLWNQMKRQREKKPEFQGVLPLQSSDPPSYVLCEPILDPSSLLKIKIVHLILRLFTF